MMRKIFTFLMLVAASVTISAATHNAPLKVGDVIRYGDQIAWTDGDLTISNLGYSGVTFYDNQSPITLLRKNPGDYFASSDGAYYVFEDNGASVGVYYGGTEFPVPDSNDGLVVTSANGTIYTLAVYGTEQEQGIDDIINPNSSNRKFFKDGQLLIEHNGKTYNALGAEVK